MSSYGNYKSYSDCIGCYGGLGPSNISGDEKYDGVIIKNVIDYGEYIKDARAGTVYECIYNS